jgi:hypothetical protein
MPGRECWSGTIQEWQLVTVNLNGYAGQPVQLRWRFGSDQGVGKEGWYVDDVCVFQATYYQPPPQALTLLREDNSLVLRWRDSGFANYTIFSGDSLDGSFDNLEGQTADTLFALPLTLAPPQRFFIIVGEY